MADCCLRHCRRSYIANQQSAKLLRSRFQSWLGTAEAVAAHHLDQATLLVILPDVSNFREKQYRPLGGLKPVGEIGTAGSKVSAAAGRRAFYDPFDVVEMPLICARRQ